jgi:DNA-directed RNA polymerase subunit RPC12/RpoP
MVRSLKCPECGAVLTVEEGRNTYFCSYCGSKIAVTNDNEYTYRHVDEAKIKQAETDRLIKMRELEIMEKNSSLRKTLTIIWLSLTLSLIIIAISIMIFGGNDDIPGWALGFMFSVYICAPIIGCGAYLVFKVIPEKENNKYLLSNGGVMFPKGFEPFGEKRAEVVRSALLAAGFKNIQLINLHDLKLGLITKPGTIEAVAVDGTPISSGGRVYLPEAVITITYHGR